ncbi:LOW QUALITY PROTEIN: protein SAR DEFICIENT 4 [Syzygium oleosum]|uniref:LOW QUALITY PROTEIN: protein SAR DEFICIENT 4 n=1 Tax=Syzygium oleosum TaxID=219896 RepID=UPI0024B8863C|nr:LOW QUALITY PROTEIN: protein SAR DEFICIENT 4 [Syzygium oleosum]
MVHHHLRPSPDDFLSLGRFFFFFRFNFVFTKQIAPNLHSSKHQIQSLQDPTMASSYPNANPIFIAADSIHALLSHQSLIRHFRSTLSSSVHTPLRHSHPLSAASASLLLMPSWSSHPSLPYIGVKLVTHFPGNSSALNLPGVHAVFVLFSSLTGQPLATADATVLTLYRTACVSGLASELLSRTDSKVLVMVGSGSLAPHLIRAHLAARPGIERVIIWNRSPQKAAALAAKMSEDEGLRAVRFDSGEILDEIVGLGDIVSCATNSEEPLVRGERLKAGAHLDLVGSFKETMRECDDAALGRAGRVFVDCAAAFVEAGELVGAAERGVAVERGGELAELAGGARPGRRSEEEVTVFKSVGSAVVDLLAAQLVYEEYVKRSGGSL